MRWLRSRGLVTALVVVVAAALVLLMAGCSTSSSIAQQARAGTDQGYVAGDGSLVELSADQRGDPVEVSGVSAEGEPIDLARWRGDVVVLNVWYAACGPCRVEAPDLNEVATAYADDGVRFVGLNTRDDAPTAQAFQRSFEIGYPSLLDTDGGAVLALRGEVSPQAVPTTLVIDRQGRVAARVLGVVQASTLGALVDSALAET